MGKASPIGGWREVAAKLCILYTGFRSFYRFREILISVEFEKNVYAEVYRVKNATEFQFHF